MKKIFFIFFFLVIVKNFFSQVMWQIKTDEVKKWYYADGDEFNKEKVNTYKWKYGPDWGNALVKQDVVFTDGNNVYQANGCAHFVLKKERVLATVYPWEIDSVWAKKNKLKIEDGKMWFNYTAGELMSHKKYKYGFFECRFKSNPEKGCWPAFWLFGGEPNNEIDWMELKGERYNQWHTDVHCTNGCYDYRGGFLNLQKDWGGWTKTSKPLADGFNIISGEWNENYLIFYLNGEPACYFAHRYEIPMWLILNTSQAADHEAFNPGPDKSTKYPNEFLIDYVRIWTDKDTVKENVQLNFLNSERNMLDVNENEHAKIKKKVNFIYKKDILKKEKGTVTFLPLEKSKYSLIFQGNSFTDVKIEILNSKNEKVKEITLNKPFYLVIELAELKSDKYTINIYTLGKVLTHTFLKQ